MIALVESRVDFHVLLWLSLFGSVLLFASCTAEKPQTPPAGEVEKDSDWTPAASSASAGSTEVHNLVAQGNIEYRQLHFDTALDKYDAAIRKDARYAIAHNNRGLALHKLGRLDDAIAAITKAKDLNEGKAPFWLNLGKVCAAAGQYDPALRALKRAVKLDSSMADAVYNRLWILAQTEKWDEAAKVAASLAEMPNAPSQSEMLRGIVEAQRGDPRLLAQACCNGQDLPQLWCWLAEWNQCLGTGGAAALPAEAKSHLREATTAMATEQFATAKDRLTQVAALAPQSPIPHWLTAMLCLAEGKNDEAEQEMAKTKPLLPKFRVAANDGSELLLYVDGACRGRAPVTVQFLPGTHLIGVVRRAGDEYSVFSKSGVFTAGGDYPFPPVTFERTGPLDQLSLPADLRGEVAAKLAGVVNSIGVQLLPIPPGEFQMGSVDGASNEKPQHKVRITQTFYLGATEVTQEQYERVMGQNPSRFKGDPQRPVVNVSWEDAVEFCQKLSAMPHEQRAGRVYRLPTEAEWEYACRAGSQSNWCFGDDESALKEYAWYQANAGNTTHPVGQRKPNAWGLYDMHGNVWEWCADWYKSDYYASSPREDPKGPTVASPRVVRGGGWGSAAANCRSADRSGDSPEYRGSGLGFRLAAVQSQR